MDENREFQIFENYIKSACRKIMSQRKKNEVREELYSHLLEEYERNSALGMDDETAQLKAIDKMGDEEKIAEEFGALYSISPPEYMRSSLNFIIWGIILTVFEFNFLFEGIPEFLKFVGTAILIYGLAKLRKSERQLHKAMYLVVITHIANTVSNLIAMHIPKFEPVTLISYFISVFLNISLYWWIFSGIKNLCDKIKTKEENKPRMVLAFVMWLIYTQIGIIAFIYEAPELAYIVIVPIIAALWQLNKAKKYLSNTDPEFELEHPLIKSEKIVCWIMIFIIAVTPIFTMIGLGNMDPESQLYSPADTTVAQETVVEARKHLANLGLPQKNIDDLPDSEVLKYTNATYMQDEYTHYALLNDMGEETEMYFFYFPDHSVRVLMCVELSNELKTNHRNGLYMHFNEGFIAFNNKSPENYTDSHGYFFVALSEKNGKTYSSKAFSEYTTDKIPAYYASAGHEFSFPDGSTNRRAYLAHTAVIGSGSEIQRLSIDGVYYYQRIPVRADLTSFNDMAEAHFEDGTTSYSYKQPVFTRNLGYYFEYFPEYCTENN